MNGYKLIDLSVVMRALAIGMLPLFFVCQSGFGQNYEYDKKIGYEAALKIEALISVYDDSGKTEYFSSVGQRLVKNLDFQHFDYQFFILDRNEPNAFSLPGGYVYITRGLLALVNSEDELACVTSHEIIHSHKRHAIKRMKKSILPGILQIPGNIAGGVLGEGFGNMINAPIILGSDIFFSSYSRKQEKEADHLGMELAAKSGYQPRQLSVILSNINKELEFLTGQPEKKSYFKSHPFTPDRVEYILKTASNLDIADIPPVVPGDNFLRQLDGIIIGQNPDLGVIKDNVLIHPEFTLHYSFPDKWRVVNTPSIIVAIAPNQEAYLVLKTIEEKNRGPHEFAKEFYDGAKNMEVEIIQNRPITINGFDAFLITLKVLDQDKDVYFQTVWIEKDSLIYNVQGAGYQNRLAEIQSSTESFRRATKEEVNGLEYSILRIVETKKGETLGSLLERFNTDKKPELITIINNLNSDTIFTKSKEIKIIEKRKFGD